MDNFDDFINTYLNQYLFEDIGEDYPDKKYKLGIFIGKFKPPHVGHYNTLLGILGAQENIFSTRYPQDIPGCVCDEAVVVVSEKPVLTDDRGKEINPYGINKLKKQGFDEPQIVDALDVKMVFTGEQALNLWQSYVDGSPVSDRVELQIGNPVNGAIKIIEDIKNNTEYKGIPISDLNIRLFIGEEEDDESEIDIAETDKQMARYNYVLKNQKELLGINDDGDDPIKVCVMARQTSATAVRNQILRIAVEEQDLETLRENIPQHVDLNAFWDIASMSLIR